MDNKHQITCRICGNKYKRIYGHHLKSHGLTSEMYLEKFPNAPLYSEEDCKKTTVKSGDHMKKEKYRKIFSEKIKGEKNPNHTNNTTKIERQMKSPFSKKFIKYDQNLTEKELEKIVSDFAKSALSNRISDTTLEYWLNKGYSEEVAKEKLSERQRTFSLEICIEKYGEKKGIDIWKKRQEKWVNNLTISNYSKISQELFIAVYEKLLENNFNEKVYFAKLDRNNNIHDTNKNYEFRLKLKDRIVLPDFFIPKLKLIIEFDGTYFHDSPERKKLDKERDKSIIESGYNIIHIKEKDYIKDKKLTVEKIVEIIL